MKYYKIIENGIIVGAITSNDFMRYLPATDCFVRANEQTGEYATYKGNFYRSTWMKPITQQAQFVQAQIIAIEEEEYNTYIQAFTVNEIIVNELVEDVEEEQAPHIDLIQQASIDFARDSKISEMSYTCRKTIENGFNLELRQEIHHFSLDTQDQLNLISLSAMAQTQSMIPYHADGESCIFYTSEEINEIVETATAFKIYHTTYYNALKNYINALETVEEIGAITYGTPIPEEYKSDVLRALEQ